MKKPILSMSAIVDRETIELFSKKHPKGKLYELKSVWDLGPTEHATIIDRNNVCQELLQKTKRTPAQERMLDKALGDVAAILVIGLEPAVLADLTISMRAAILFSWIAANNKSTGEEGADPNPRSRSRRTGSGSSRGSKSSTAATRRAGSTVRRGSSKRS